MSWEAWLEMEGASGQALRKRAYDGAGRGRRVRDWNAPSSSANREVSGSIELLRARSRDLCRNNSWGTGVANCITDEVVGEGIRPRVRHDGKGKKRAVQKIQDQLLWWAESIAVDADGKNNLYGLQELISRTRVQSGSVLIRRRVRDPGFSSRRGLRLPLQIHVMEPDFLDTTRDGPVSRNGAVSGVIIQGVEFDLRNQVRGYHMHATHPGDGIGRFGGKSYFVPAREMLHLFHVERPGQVVGVPELAPAMITLRDLHATHDAALLRMKLANCFAAFIKRSADGEEPETDEAGNHLESLEPGIIEYLELGEDVVFANPPAAPGLAEFSTIQLRAVAQAIGLTYEVVSGDYSKVNFSSGRMAWQRAYRTVGRHRRDLECQVLDPMFDWFLDAMRLADPSLVIPDLYCSWATPRRTLVDPGKEVAALEQEVRAGLCSWQEAVASLGRDPGETLDQIEEHQRELDARGITIASDPRKSTQGGAANGAPGAAEGKEPADGEDPNEESEADAERGFRAVGTA
ncbi:MAG: phage portal protein [Planctomycetaceae bacterium]|nr:phage portal protein [Planctomycetaceae bacterium]